MKYPQTSSAAGNQLKIAFVMVAGFVASLVLSMTMVSVVVHWLK